MIYDRNFTGIRPTSVDFTDSETVVYHYLGNDHDDFLPRHMG